MRKYLVVIPTKDALGVEQLSVVTEADTRAEVAERAKDLAPGIYSLLSVLRPEFTVRDSFRVVTKVVDWGSTKQPRKRKGRGTGDAVVHEVEG